MPGKKRKKPGPKPVVAKIEGDWIEALKRALHIKRPKEWPTVDAERENEINEGYLKRLKDDE